VKGGRRRKDEAAVRGEGSFVGKSELTDGDDGVLSQVEEVERADDLEFKDCLNQWERATAMSELQHEWESAGREEEESTLIFCDGSTISRVLPLLRVAYLYGLPTHKDCGESDEQKGESSQEAKGKIGGGRREDEPSATIPRVSCRCTRRKNASEGERGENRRRE